MRAIWKISAIAVLGIAVIGCGSSENGAEDSGYTESQLIAMSDKLSYELESKDEMTSVLRNLVLSYNMEPEVVDDLITNNEALISREVANEVRDTILAEYLNKIHAAGLNENQTEEEIAAAEEIGEVTILDYAPAINSIEFFQKTIFMQVTVDSTTMNFKLLALDGQTIKDVVKYEYIS